ncbi:hypothetical protein H9I48_04860 [Wolbachia pipientis]|uniref:hypothetical protein n=1 Tax=Wolbachia pipientis TaxID=955 RepID=UPI0016517BED|nr:hypothetical protein [Wolbachia pipientis]MBC6686533.1 hypothetical protein [Wolbachia pipientis]
MVKKVCSIRSNEKKLPNLKVLLDDYGFSQLYRIQKEGWIIDLLKFSIRLCSIIQRKTHTPHLLPLRNKT